MKIVIQNEELFLMVAFLESYWISLLAFKMPYVPIILLLAISSVGLYALSHKLFGKFKESYCKRFKKSYEILIGSFLLGLRILYALVGFLVALELAYMVLGLTGLTYLDSQITQVWCFSNTIKLLEEIINTTIIQILVLI